MSRTAGGSISLQSASKIAVSTLFKTTVAETAYNAFLVQERIARLHELMKSRMRVRIRT